MVDDGLRRRLEGVVGGDAVGPWSGHRNGEGGLAVAAGTVDAVTEVLSVCREHRAPLVPVGGGTLMDVGGPAPPDAVAIELRRLNRMIDHDDANLTVTVEAGMTIETLQSALRGRGQFVAFDTHDPAGATVGGLISTNLNGYRRVGYRSIRDLVIGMRVVTGKGEMVKAGGKVVKNVAGYDMCKLFTGSLGTLGIITEITARVEPIPEVDATFVVESDEASEALRFGAAIAASQLLPTAVAILNPQFAHGALGRRRHVVLLRFEGLATAVARQEREIRAQRSGRAHAAAERLDGAASEKLWLDVHRLGWNGEGVWLRLIVPAARVGEAWALLAARSPGGMAADVMSGTVWALINNESGSLDDLPSLADRLGGHYLIARSPADLRIPRWGPPPEGLPLMRALKAAFDPDGVLNPNRFLL